MDKPITNLSESLLQHSNADDVQQREHTYTITMPRIHYLGTDCLSNYSNFAVYDTSKMRELNELITEARDKVDEIRLHYNAHYEDMQRRASLPSWRSRLRSAVIYTVTFVLAMLAAIIFRTPLVRLSHSFDFVWV